MKCCENCNDSYDMCHKCNEDFSEWRSKLMNFNEYQYKAQQTATYPQETTAQALTYLSLGLNGEAGEVADKIKKWFRGDYELTPLIRHEIVKELGDVLWYISEMARVLNFNLDEIAETNITKLFDRKDRNRLHGDGDNR